MINRQEFYIRYRKYFGSIQLPKTVKTIEAILDYAAFLELSDERLAYVLATAHHEARHRRYINDFYPIIERGGWNYIIKKYWYNSRVRRWLGNTNVDDAWLFRGRGLVQLTGRVNYRKFGIENNPQLALDTEMSVRILIDGMMNGAFTGASLCSYVNSIKKDYYNARRVVNGLDCAVVIAKNARLFLKVIEESQRCLSAGFIS